MKAISEMSLGELAAHIDSTLQKMGIDVVLSGGACVAIYSDHKYVSKDLDFIVRFRINSKEVTEIMTGLGFKLRGNYFFHPSTLYFVEFIPGPPAVGQDPIREIVEIKLETGTVRAISPTDSVKDRLAAFFHWGDRQGLEQAVLVALSKQVDFESIEAWAIREGKETEYKKFIERFEDENQS